MNDVRSVLLIVFLLNSLAKLKSFPAIFFSASAFSCFSTVFKLETVCSVNELVVMVVYPAFLLPMTDSRPPLCFTAAPRCLYMAVCLTGSSLAYAAYLDPGRLFGCDVLLDIDMIGVILLFDS